MQAKPEEGQITSFGRWSCACQDVDGIMFQMLHSSSIWSNTRLPELDKALDAGRESCDTAELFAAPLHPYIEQRSARNA